MLTCLDTRFFVLLPARTTFDVQAIFFEVSFRADSTLEAAVLLRGVFPLLRLAEELKSSFFVAVEQGVTAVAESGDGVAIMQPSREVSVGFACHAFELLLLYRPHDMNELVITVEFVLDFAVDIPQTQERTA